VRDEAEEVVRVGEHGEVVSVVFELYPVPAPFVAYARMLYVVLQVRDVAEPVYAPVPNNPDSVVVAPYAVVRPYVIPRVVTVSEPIPVMVPFPVAVVAVMDETA
jgi:hypothetical protein